MTMSATAKSIDANPGDARPGEAAAPQALTDGFHLLIDALKLNDVETIYGVPGIPITDLCRFMQGEGLRVLSFRHEQSAGYAAGSEEHTSELQSLMRNSYAVFCLKKKKT